MRLRADRGPSGAGAGLPAAVRWPGPVRWLLADLAVLLLTHSKISQLTVVLPLILLVIGVLAIAGAVLLLRRDERPGTAAAAPAHSEPAGRV